MMNRLIIIILVLVLIISLYFIIEKKAGFTDLQILNTPLTQESNMSNLSQTFEGTLPCADCSGLKTILTLTKSSQYSAEGTYTLSETYLGKIDKPFITKDKWTLVKGAPESPDATVYQLLSPNSQQPANYLLVNSNTLELVDQNFATIDSPFKLTLTLKK